MRMIGKDAIAVLPAAPVRHRNGDIEYAYRQDSQFYYLSGFPEPDAVAVLVPGRPQAEYLLFVREHDALRESWDGARAGTDGAVERYGADDAFPIADIDEILPGLMEQRSRMFYSMGTHLEFDPRMLGWVNGMRVHARQGSGAPQEFVALGHVLDDMRLYKSRAEQGELCGAPRRSPWARTAAPCASRVRGAWNTRSWPSCCTSSARTTPTSPIIRSSAAAPTPASCTTATTISACATATCCCSTRAASTTTTPRTSRRTFPVSGRFTPAQRAVYEVVLEAQLAAIDKVRPGNHWNQPHEAAVRAITQGLVEARPAQGRRRPAHQGAGVPAVLQSSYRALAGPRRARRRRLQGRRGMAGARARHGAHRRARDLHPPLARAFPRSSGTSACASRTTCW